MKSPFGLRRIMPSFVSIFTLAAVTLLAGCGQKGPLYMPGTKAPTGQSKNAIPTIPAATTVTPAPTTDSK